MIEAKKQEQAEGEEQAADRALVRRMAAREEEALRDFYQRHVGAVAGLVGRILRNREDAREAVQDTFVKAWKAAAAYRPERAPVMAWLVFIARHAAIDRLRRSRREEAGFSILPAAEPPPAASDAADEVRLRLGELTGAQRQALELAFFEDCTQAEIARRMQVPVTTVKNHLHRGLARLRQKKGTDANGRGMR